jgi:Mce-associated membrane protein
MGRLLVGVVVVRADGQRFGLARLVVRDLAHLLDTLPLLLGWLWPLWDARGRTFADLLTRTEVHQVGKRPERRRLTSAILAGLAAVALVVAGLGYFGIYRPQAAVDETRQEISKQGPQIVIDMLSYDAASLQDDFTKSLALVTDSYRPQLEKQQAAVRKAGPVDNDYWVTNSAVLKASKNEAVMLLMLQGQRGEAPNQRLITATVQVSFQKSAAGQWQVADLSVLAKPNTMRPVVEEVPDPNAKPAPGQPAPAQPAQPHPAQPAQSAPNAQPNPPRQGR